MDIMEAMKTRHSVRRLQPRSIEPEKAEILQMAVEEINRDSGFHFQLVLDEPEAFTGLKAHYGSIRNCTHYFALVGEEGRLEDVGYHGEKLVLLAQRLGLNTCWVALTYNKRKARVDIREGERLYVVIALGYGENQGVPHKERPLAEVCTVEVPMPDWFRAGVEAAMLAPTAINQQKFHLTLIEGNTVKAEALKGPYAQMDLGIVKYHFELGAAPQAVNWV